MPATGSCSWFYHTCARNPFGAGNALHYGAKHRLARISPGGDSVIARTSPNTLARMTVQVGLHRHLTVVLLCHGGGVLGTD